MIYRPFKFWTILVKNSVNNDKSHQDGPKFEWSVTGKKMRYNKEPCLHKTILVLVVPGLIVLLLCLVAQKKTDF